MNEIFKLNFDGDGLPVQAITPNDLYNAWIRRASVEEVWALFQDWMRIYENKQRDFEPSELARILFEGHALVTPLVLTPEETEWQKYKGIYPHQAICFATHALDNLIANVEPRRTYYMRVDLTFDGGAEARADALKGRLKWVNAEEAEALTGVKASTWRNRAARNKVRGADKPGRDWHFPLESILNYPE